MSTFDYTSVEQQIFKLKSQNLIIEDEVRAKSILQVYGYYNIINGYRDPYIVRNYDKKTYMPGVTFEQLYALFMLDHKLRDAIMNAMVDLEESLRAAAADIIGEDFGSDHTKYLAIDNYRDRKVNNEKFNRSNLLSSLNKLANTSRNEPINYYRNTHGIIPPWILLKGTTFATLVNFIRLFKGPQRDKLIRRMYGDRINSNNAEEYKDFLSDSLSLCLEYRNLAAHGGRVYNYIPNSTIRRDGYSGLTGLIMLRNVLSFFQNQHPYMTIKNALSESVQKYCSTYPDDVSRLESAVGIKISIEKCLFLNESTGIYHRISNCCGARNCKRVFLSSIDTKNIRYCKKCINSP